LGAGTGTAWLAELIGKEDKTRATAIATSANFLGLGVGALVSGLLAQYTPWPLQLPFIVYLLVLVTVAALAWRTKETIAHAATRLRELPLRPQLSVPSGIRSQFVAPAITGFGAMALVGFYAALEPSIAAENLHQGSHAVAGALFAELAFACAATIVLTQRQAARLDRYGRTRSSAGIFHASLIM
jgi:MFS family permease